MTDKILFVQTSDDGLPSFFSNAADRGVLDMVRQDRLTDSLIDSVGAIITCANVDQIDLAERQAALEAFLDRGGRLVLSCQFRRVFVDGLSLFVPTARAKREDYALTRLLEHPVFAGIPAVDLETRRGVAGFYGRGYNPLPAGATAITGLGPHFLPVDWEWRRPAGGRVFAHAGNDLWVLGDGMEQRQKIADSLVCWCLSPELVA